MLVVKRTIDTTSTMSLGEYEYNRYNNGTIIGITTSTNKHSQLGTKSSTNSKPEFLEFGAPKRSSGLLITPPRKSKSCPTKASRYIFMGNSLDNFS